MTMSLLPKAKGSVATFLNTIYPGLEAAGRILHPDDQEDVATLLRADPTLPVVILHTPQLVTAGAVPVYAVLVSVCRTTENQAITSADPLLAALTAPSPIVPTTRLSPMATALHEDGFWRVAVSFTLRIKP